jgi:HEAT repeat protein
VGAGAPVLVEALLDEEEQVRSAAAEALGNFGSMARETVPALGRAVSDAKAEVRVAAARALWAITREPEPAITALSSVVMGKGGTVLFSTLEKAMAALAEMGIEAGNAVPVLLEAFKKETTDAAMPLVKAGADPQVIAPLFLKRLGDVFDPRTGAAARATIRDALLALGKPAVPFLADALASRDDAVRLQVIEILGTRGREAGDAVPAVTTALEDPDEDIRYFAAWALKRIRGG